MAQEVPRQIAKAVQHAQNAIQTARLRQTVEA